MWTQIQFRLTWIAKKEVWIKGKIYYNEKMDSLLSYREWWCEPYEEEEYDEENHVPIVGVGYYRITQTSIRARNPSRGTLVLYEEENDSRNWEFDLSNRLIVAEWNNPEFHDGFAAVDMDTIQNVSEARISNLPTLSNFKIGRSGNSTLIQCSIFWFFIKIGSKAIQKMPPLDMNLLISRIDAMCHTYDLLSQCLLHRLV